MRNILRSLERRSVRLLTALSLGAVIAASGCGGGSAGAAAVPPRCQAEWVSVNDAGFAGVAAGTLVESLQLTVSQPCWLRGAPSLRLLDAEGRQIAAAHGDRDTTRARKFAASPSRPGYVRFYYHQPTFQHPPCKRKAVAVDARVPGTRDWVSGPMAADGLVMCADDAFGPTDVGSRRENGPLRG